jgi:hypothetical protein
MIDPFTAIAAASTAYKSIKRVIGHADDITHMGKSLGQWYGACADIQRAQSQRKNPTFFEKATKGKSIEEEAMNILIHQKTLREREMEIATLLNYRFGVGTYEEMLGMRRQIRKDREAVQFAEDERKRQLINSAAIFLLCIATAGLVAAIVYMFSYV